MLRLKVVEIKFGAKDKRKPQSFSGIFLRLYSGEQGVGRFWIADYLFRRSPR